MGDALHTHGGVTSAQEARLADGGLLAVHGPGALDVRTGVLHGPGSTALITSTADTAPMAVLVAAHHAVTMRQPSEGPYRGATEVATRVPIDAAPASGSRIDVVWVKQNDSSAGVLNPDASTGWLVSKTTGTAATSPTKPAIPTGAEELGTVRVDAGATRTDGAGVTIANTARLTAARGAPIPVRSKAERDSLTPYDGLTVVRLDVTGAPIERHTGSRWKRIGLDPVSADRVVNVDGLPITSNSTASPAGIGLALPALPIGHIVVVALSTDYYIEGSGSPQSLAADMAAGGATRLQGHAHGDVSMSALYATVTTRQTWRIDQEAGVSFTSTYRTGLGSQRAVLKREDWTAWL